MSLPLPGFDLDPSRTALVVTDPQVDFLSPKGTSWEVVGASVTANRTVENPEARYRAAKSQIHLSYDHVIGFMIAVRKATTPAWPKPGQLWLEEVLLRDRC